MSIGRGWLDDSLTIEEKKLMDESWVLNDFFADLLKNKLDECFASSRKNKELING